MGVSKRPMPQLGEDHYECKVLFKVGEDYVSYVQGKFRVLANRFPDAKYRVNRDSGAIIAYEGKKLVGMVMHIRCNGQSSKRFPQLEGEPAMRAEAVEAGFLKRPKLEI